MNGILLVDKPAGMTSHDVVAIARRGLRTRGIGHAGTLDPMATGLLVLAVGEGRKLLRYLSLDDKQYVATLRLGEETDSLDADGEVVERAAVPDGLDEDRIEEALARFVGEIAQRAPVVSAIKRDGVPLHARARRGERVVPPVRQVVAHELRVLGVRSAPPEVELEVRCGKGFYVRSLGRDLARALGTVGHLSALRRTASGHFDVSSAVPIELLRRAGADEEARTQVGAWMVSVRAALPDAPARVLDEEGVAHARAGRAIPLDRMIGDEPVLPAHAEPVILLDAAAVPIALARLDGEVLRVVRGFNL